MTSSQSSKSTNKKDKRNVSNKLGKTSKSIGAVSSNKTLPFRDLVDSPSIDDDDDTTFRSNQDTPISTNSTSKNNSLLKDFLTRQLADDREKVQRIRSSSSFSFTSRRRGRAFGSSPPLLPPEERIRLLERRMSESNLPNPGDNDQEEDFCSGEPAGSANNSALRQKISRSMSPEENRSGSARSSHGSVESTPLGTHVVLSTTEPLSNQSITVRYWPTAVWRNETRVSASTTLITDVSKGKEQDATVPSSASTADSTVEPPNKLNNSTPNGEVRQTHGLSNGHEKFGLPNGHEKFGLPNGHIPKLKDNELLERRDEEAMNDLEDTLSNNSLLSAFFNNQQNNEATHNFSPFTSPTESSSISSSSHVESDVGDAWSSPESNWTEADRSMPSLVDSVEIPPSLAVPIEVYKKTISEQLTILENSIDRKLLSRPISPVSRESQITGKPENEDSSLSPASIPSEVNNLPDVKANSQSQLPTSEELSAQPEWWERSTEMATSSKLPQESAEVVPMIASTSRMDANFETSQFCDSSAERVLVPGPSTSGQSSNRTENETAIVTDYMGYMDDEEIDDEEEQKLLGILKITETLKISKEILKLKKPKKSVRFIDSIGKPLTELKEFNETEELLQQIHEFENIQLASRREREENPSGFKFAFNQPAADYLVFRKKLDTKLVSLENTQFQGTHLVCGTIKVKNVAFEKKVFVRATFNSWETVSDIVCKFVDNGCHLQSIYDTFRFEMSIPTSWYSYHKIQFCVCYVENGREHWDNNDGENYSIISNTQAASGINFATHNPFDANSPLFSFWQANSSADQQHPYW